jgi:hypothetical protein
MRLCQYQLVQSLYTVSILFAVLLSICTVYAIQCIISMHHTNNTALCCALANMQGGMREYVELMCEGKTCLHPEVSDITTYCYYSL